jgi:alpha-L-rhamnosidase
MTVIATDSSWQAAVGPVISSSLYDGEVHDGRTGSADWSRPGGAGGGEWTPAVPHQRDRSTLVPAEGPPIRCTATIEPVRSLRRDDGSYLLDFGQNLVGRLAITVSGPRGTRVALRHAEVLVDGDLATPPLRQARATDEYVLHGEGSEHWEPRFTIHGFRYATVTGWPGELTAGSVVARVYHTDMESAGTFECSDPLVQRLHDNVRWSMRGNFVGIPTDCPARDERLGWTGDVQVFAPTALFLYDCAALLDSWLTDVGLEQLPDGTVPWFVPVIPSPPPWTPIRPGAGWGDVAALTPVALYQATGDAELLRRHYVTARAWVDLIASLAGPGRLWDTGFQLGDWLLMQTECPSWLYPVTRGATTIWERWDSLHPDGTLHPAGMTSFNHFALGSVADWMHRVVAGLAPAAPGYRKIEFRPRPGGGLTSAAASHQTPYGRAAISWEIAGEEMRVTMTVPPNCTATAHLPGVPPVEMGCGTLRMRVKRSHDGGLG